MLYLGDGAQIPFLGKTEISCRANELLDTCWDGGFPIDVEAICDHLSISVLPVQRLKEEFGVDAYISSDFKNIYVDWQGYIDESPRYRFSLAHELGHYVLHREYFSSSIESYEEWQGSACYPSCSHIEYQANYFAGSLLAPEDELLHLLNREFDGSFAKNCWSKSHGELRHIFYNVRRFFMVSEQVVAHRMRDVFPGSDGLDEVAAAIYGH